MRNRTLINAAIGLVLLGALFVRNVRADEWDKKTIVSFSAPVQIPGTVLPAGTYVFKVADNHGHSRLSHASAGQNHHQFQRTSLRATGSLKGVVLSRRQLRSRICLSKAEGDRIG